MGQEKSSVLGLSWWNRSTLNFGGKKKLKKRRERKKEATKVSGCSVEQILRGHGLIKHEKLETRAKCEA